MSDQAEKEVLALNTIRSLLKTQAYSLGLPENIITRYVRGAKDVFRRIVEIKYGDRKVQAVILSTKASRRRPEHTVVVKDLYGKLKKIKIGVPLEEAYHNVTVTEEKMSCDCPSALITATKADVMLKWIAQRHGLKAPEMFFVHHVLCKHTVAILSKGISVGVIPISEKLLNSLRIAVLGAALAAGMWKPIEREILELLREKKH